MPILIGTSGWQYRDWRGRFYPSKQRLELKNVCRGACVHGPPQFYSANGRRPARKKPSRGILAQNP